MATHEPPPDFAEFGPRRKVGGLVAAVGGEPADVLGPRAVLGEDGNDVLQRPLELRRDRFVLEDLLGVPAHLAGAAEIAARAAREGAEAALEQVLAEIDETAKATFGSLTINTMLKLVERRR